MRSPASSRQRLQIAMGENSILCGTIVPRFCRRSLVCWGFHSLPTEDTGRFFSGSPGIATEEASLHDGRFKVESHSEDLCVCCYLVNSRLLSRSGMNVQSALDFIQGKSVSLSLGTGINF